MTTKRLHVCVAAAVALVVFSPPALAQLLQKLTTQVQTPATTIAGRAMLRSQRVLSGGRPGSGAVLEQRQQSWLLSPRWGDAVMWSGDPMWGQHIVWGTTDGPEGTVWGNVAPIADGNGSPPDRV